MPDFCICDEFRMDDKTDSFGFMQTDAPFPIPIELGGTGAGSAADAREKLGLGDAALANIDEWLNTSGDAAGAKATGDIIYDATGNRLIEMTPGGYIPCNTLTGIDVTVVRENVNYRHAAVACTEGDVFTVSAKGASVGRAWAFVDANGNRLSAAAAAATVTDLVLTAPTNAAWLIINDNNTGVYSYYGRKLKDVVADLEEEQKEGIGAVTYMRPAANVAYSWWVKNRAVDSDGTLFFTYISQDAQAGVACRYPDGTIRRKDLYASTSCDDHNAPGVVLVNGTVVVVGAKGHNASGEIYCFVATEPHTIECDFINRTQSMPRPTGYQYANSYAQVFTAGSVIYDVFRVKQMASGSSVVQGICWVCAKSSDLGQTWQIYRLMRINSQKLDYIWLEDVEGSDTLKRIILQRNASATPLKPIRAGFVDLASNAVYDNAMNSLEKPMLLVPGNELIYRDNVVCAEYDDFTKIIDEETGYRIRVLDVWDSSDSNLEFLYARTAVADNQTDFILYKYENGTSIEIAHIGRPFCTTSLYVTGACFAGDPDTVVYSKNDSDTNDGRHSLHMAKLADGAVVSDTVLKRSKQLLARPARFDDGGVMYLAGKYNEVAGAEYTSWTLSAAFL